VERCYQIGFGLANAINERGGNRGGTGAQNEPVTDGVDRGTDHGKIVEQLAGGIHISVSEPGGTVPSMASGVGPIGLIGGSGVASSGLSVLWVLCPMGLDGTSWASAYVAAVHLPAGSCRVSTNPAARVPASPATYVARYWRPRPCGSATAFTGSASSLTFTGVARCCSHHTWKSSAMRWRRGSRALSASMRSTGSRHPRANKGSRHHSAQVSKLPSGLPRGRTAAFWRPHRQIVSAAV